MKRCYSFFFVPLFILTLSSCVPEKPHEILVSYKSANIIGYENKPIIVDTEFLPSMYKIDSYAKENGVIIYVTSSFRTPDQKLTGAIVPPSKKSNHLAGHAIDMNVYYDGILYDSRSLKKSNMAKLPPNVRNFINDVRNNKALRWGGDFNTEDPVHIDDDLGANPNVWQSKFEACQQYGINNQ